MAAGPLIPLSDYQRIFRVINTVLDGAEAHTENACLFFSVAGAFILEKIYKKSAMPVAGAAFYKINEESGADIAYAHLNGNEVSSSNDAFHCWIQCEGYAIDFMSPIFQESMLSRGHTISTPRKMFQKRLADMASSPHHLYREGDYYLQPNAELTRSLLLQVTQKKENEDLVNICLHWFKKPPKEMLGSFSMGDDRGMVTHMKLTDKKVIGAW